MEVKKTKLHLLSVQINANVKKVQHGQLAVTLTLAKTTTVS